MKISRELKVYNRFEELILHLRFVPGDPLPLRIEDGTQELRNAVRSLVGHDFDQTVVIEKQRRRFQATWGSPEYLDALAGYWSSNFGWRTRLVEMSLGWVTPQMKGTFDLNSMFKINCSQGLENYTKTQNNSLHNFADIEFPQTATVFEWQSWQKVESLSSAHLAGLFDSPAKAVPVYHFHPNQSALKFMSSTDLSVGYGVNQTTAMVRLKDHDPKQALIFAEKNAEAWAA